MKRVLCPKHKEKSPSCVVYTDHAFCYGCGATIPLDELGFSPGESIDPEPEDLDATFAYIDSLPKQTIRGLELPVDREAYYVPWAGRDYYKRRLFKPWNEKVKYLGAAGHKKPIFVANQTNSSILMLVEGEINALSAAVAFPEINIHSPGGAGDFSSKQTKKYYTFIRDYNIIIIVADEDKAGAIACIEMMAQLQGKAKLKAKLVKPDFNEILVQFGKDRLREQIKSLVDEALG